MIRSRTALPVVLALFVPALCRPQIPDVSPLDGYTAGQVQQGGPSGSYALSSLETLNTANGQLSITIPLATVQGRGNVSVPLSVNLTPPIWDVTANSYEYDCGEYSCTIGWLYSMTATGLLAAAPFSAGQFVFRSSGDECVPVNGSTSRWNNVLTRGTFVSANGTETEFVDQQTNGTPEPGNLGYNRGTVFVADNGSLAKFTASASVTDSTSCTSAQTTYPSGTLVMRDGTKYTITSGVVTKIEDHNGNYTYFGNTVTDSLGRSYTIGYGSSSDTLQYYGAAGASRTITVHYAPLSSVLASGQSLETYNQLWSIGAGLQNGTQQYDPPGLVSEIDLADGSKYLFTYDSYGEVAQMTLPTGDYIQYSYASQESAGETSAGSVDLLINGQEVSTTVPSAYMYTLSRSLLERREYVNGAYVGKMDFPSMSEIDWYNASGNLLAKQTQTIASEGTLPSSGTNYNPPQYNQRTVANYYDANGSTLLESQSMAYYQPSNCKVNCATIETLTTTLGSWVKKSTYTYDQYNNVNAETDTDWGYSGSPGGVLRVTDTTYDTSSGLINDNILGLPATVKVYDGSNNLYTWTQYSYDSTSIANDPGISGTYHDNTNFNGSQPRGNLTSIQQCLNTSSCTWLTTSMVYDIAGNLMSVTDANNHATWFSYSDNYTDGVNRDSYGYVTAVTNALGQYSFQANYDYHLGQPVLTADIMGAYTSRSYGSSNFATDRLIQVNYANGGHTYYSFLTPTQILIQQDQNTSGDKALESEVKYDGFGRLFESDTFENSNQYIATLYSYDVLGRLTVSTNPSRYTFNPPGSDGLGYTTTYSYDGLGRQTSVTTPDGAVSSTVYTSGYTTLEDAAGNSRVLQYDGLGRLCDVWEEPGGGPNYQTTYTNGANNTLQKVTQGSETRTFYYDSLGRLTGSTQPETGTIGYTYDNVGNVLTRTDARNVKSTYTYDALNRMTSVGYNDGKTYTASFGYDGSGGTATGHLTSVSNYTATLSYTSFDVMGNVLASSEVTGGGTYNFSYGYNLAGVLTSESYPSGRVLTTGYDGANRPTTVAGRRNGGAQTNYVTSVSYWPHGAPNTMVYGNTLNVVEGYFNKELQVTGMWHVIAGNPNEFLWLEYPIWGTTNNNGNLQGKTEYAGGPAPWTALPYYSQSFTYDGVNRLETATDTTGSTVNWSRTFNYDQYGNAWVPTASGVGYGVSTPEWNVYNTKNQVSSSPYDAAGNITALPPGYTFVYDAENRITVETNSGGLSANYYYDGMGDRVEKVLSNGQAIVSVYDAFGNLAEEYSPATTWSKDFVPFNGQTVAIENATANPCTTCYLSYDYLGTPRLVTDQNANVMGRHDYLPFGDEIPGGVAGRSSQFGPYVDNVNQKFTGQYRDTETLNDFFNARYYTAPLMRFLSADPASVAAVDPTDPQTWNAYAYVRNSPLVLVDPSGMDSCNSNNNYCNLGSPSAPPTSNPAGYSSYINQQMYASTNDLAYGSDVFQLMSNQAENPIGWVASVPEGGVGVMTPVYGGTIFLSPTGSTGISVPAQQTNAVVPQKTGMKTLNCAGYTASRSIFAQTSAQAIEFGGFIEEASDGTYSYTSPFAGNRTSLPNFYDQYNSLVQALSNGVSVAGWYHSHPVPPPTYPSAEMFSGQDLSASHYINAPGFVVTPSGIVLRLDPGPPAVTTRVPSGACHGG